MIVVMQEHAPEHAVAEVMGYLRRAGCEVQRSSASSGCLLQITGKLSGNDAAVLRELPFVLKVISVHEPFRLASRLLRDQPTVLQGDYGTIGGREPWIAIEAVGMDERLATEDDASPTSASLPYRIAAGRPFDAAVTRKPVAPDTVGALACLSIHRSPRDARFPVLFVTRQPSWGPDAWLERAERELARGGSEVVLLEAGCEYPNGERTFDISTVLQTKERTHLPIVVDIPTIAQQERFVNAMALASIAMGMAGVILRVFMGPSTDRARLPATQHWDAAVELAGWIRATSAAARKSS
jgi:3-deoxy-7-phosphoheptulonate synthase